jgi:hypothetical protein
MRKPVLACLAMLTALAPSAHAAAGTCLVLADPAGDHELPGLAVATPQLTPFLPGGLDLVGFDAVADGGAVTVTFTTAGPPDPAPGTNYEYRYEFTDAGHTYELAAGLDGGAHLPTSGVYELYVTEHGPGGSTKWPRITVDGWVDLATNRVTVQAPAAAFRVTGFPAGTTWSSVRVGTGWGAGGAAAYYSDTVPAAAGLPLVAGDGTCA